MTTLDESVAPAPLANNDTPGLLARQELILGGAYVFLSRFLDPAQLASRPQLLAAMRPRPEDYARVFSATAARIAAPVYDKLWLQLPAWPVRADQTQLKIAVAAAEDFATWNTRASEFPGGYRAVAEHLLPGVLWVAFEFTVPGSMGVAFDGLVWLDDHWAWFPKPYRALAELLGASWLYND